MKTKIPACLTALLLGSHLAGAQPNAPISWDQLGARAGADYQGDGLAVCASASGARRAGLGGVCGGFVGKARVWAPLVLAGGGVALRAVLAGCVSLQPASNVASATRTAPGL